MSADRPTDTIRDAFDRVRLDDLRGALEIHGWLTGEDSKEALDEIERAWGEIERLTRAAEEHNRRALPPFALTDSPPVDREALGRLVREVWIEWAYEQAAPKPSWLVPWDDMAECDREVDRRIGERVAQSALARPVTDGADWTPERHREARERCERATPGPWVHSPPGVDEPHVSTKIGSDGERVDWLASPRSAPSKRWHDAAFIAHARDDLPAALREIERQARAVVVLIADAAALRSELAAAREEIERLNRLVIAAANADPSWVERCTTQAAEIERLTAELAVSTAENASLMQSSLDEIGRLTAALEQRRAPADASLEARALDAMNVHLAARHRGATKAVASWYEVGPIVRGWWLAVVRAVDASRPAVSRLPAPDADTVSPAHLAAIEIVTWTDGSPEQTRHGADLIGMGPAAVAEAVARAYEEGMASQQRRDAKGRPRLTGRDADDIELARAIRDTLREVTHAGAIERLEELLDVEKEAAARPGLTEEQIETLAKSFDAKAEAEMVLSRKNREEPAEWRHEAVSVAWDEAAAFLRASRGETGPAPTWGEQAIAEHHRAADLGPGADGAPIRARPTATEPCKGPLLTPAEQADPSFADALLVAQDRHREAAAVHPTTETDRQRATLHAGDPASVQRCHCCSWAGHRLDIGANAATCPTSCVCHEGQQ